MTKAQLQAMTWHYRRFRAEGQPASAAWLGAKRHLYFMADLRATIKAGEKRSRAAKKGWKKRRANAF